jgi:hypothetical protein
MTESRGMCAIMPPECLRYDTVGLPVPGIEIKVCFVLHFRGLLVVVLGEARRAGMASRRTTFVLGTRRGGRRPQSLVWVGGKARYDVRYRCGRDVCLLTLRLDRAMRGDTETWMRDASAGIGQGTVVHVSRMALVGRRRASGLFQPSTRRIPGVSLDFLWRRSRCRRVERAEVRGRAYERFSCSDAWREAWRTCMQAGRKVQGWAACGVV